MPNHIHLLLVLMTEGASPHIIRDENDLLNHWSYIEHNPARWAEDEYHV